MIKENPENENSDKVIWFKKKSSILINNKKEKDSQN